MILCPVCGVAGPFTGSDCSGCASSLEHFCEACDRASGLDAVFCASCGTRLQIVRVVGATTAASVATPGLGGERRVVTVVLSDLSGYTAMGERLDPEEVAEMMGTVKRDATRIIESFGGTVNQFIGDEIVSVFGLPNARDDDARRAVSAALAVHARIAELGRSDADGHALPLSMHSGIQTGLLIAELRDARSGVYELTGDAINTAARLLSLAGANEVVVGETTLTAVAPYFEIEPAGSHDVRGKAFPLAAFRVVRPWADRSRFDASKARGLTRLTGRNDELRFLRNAFAELGEGRPQTVVVEADAGTGKSRLCHDFLEGLRSGSAAPDAPIASIAPIVLVGRCQAYGSVTSYLPFVHVLRDAFDVVENDTSDMIEEKTRTALRNIAPHLEQRELAYLYLLSVASVHELPVEWFGDELPRILQDAIVDLLLAISERAPVIVSLDDWHWSDAASQTTLARLARVIDGRPVMVLIAARPNEALWRSVEVERLPLGPLAEYDTEQMVGRCFEAESVQSALAAKIYERTMGNPFFVEEVCHALRHRGDVIHVEGEALYSGELNTLDFPTTVQSVVLGRVDALSPPLRDALRFASVIGREFSGAVLEQLLVAGSSVGALLTELQRLGFVSPTAGASDGRFQFKHVIIQEVTYSTLLLRERAAVHARIAEIIEYGEETDDADKSRDAESLAHHYRQAENPAKALEYLEQAGRKAASRYAFADARHHLRAAIEESLKLPDSLELRLHRARMTMLWASACIFGPSTSQFDLIELAYREALEREDDVIALTCRYWVSYLHYAIGDQFSAELESRRVIELAESLGDAVTIGMARSHLGQIFVVQRRSADAADEVAIGMRIRDDLGETAGSRGTYPFSVVQLALIAADRGQFATAHREIERSLAMVRGSGERSREASLLVCAAMSFGFEGEWMRVRDAAVSARAIAEYVGAPYHLAFAEVIDGYANFQLGARSLGMRMMRRGLIAHEQSGALLAFGLTRAYVADALEQAGEHEEAMKLALASLARADVGDRLGDDIARRVLLRCEALLRPDLVPSEIERLRSIGTARGSAREEAMVDLAGAQAYVALGQRSTAIDHADRAIEAINALGMPFFLAEAETTRRRAYDLP